jgi:positive regulator of sigma E activity
MYMVGDVPGIAKEQNRVQQNAKSSCGHCTDQGICSESFCSFFSLKPRYQT